MKTFRRSNGYVEVKGNAINSCVGCVFSGVEDDACKSGEEGYVPMGCGNNRTIWIKDSKLDELEEHMNKYQDTLSDERKNTKKVQAHLLDKIWKLRNKIVLVREDSK